MLISHQSGLAALKSHPIAKIESSDEVVHSARHFLGGQDKIFSWNVDLTHKRPWEYDPVEKKYWPRRHYRESHLHSTDTPQDAKIVWEINRFVHLPMLAQAALLSKDHAFSEEISRRMLSWIEENPFAQTINWASALEISIRLLSWTTTLLLLREAGDALHDNEAIRRSIFEQARYLAADLSTDKVVPTNHLIGEAAGLFIVASLWDYPDANAHATRARRILEAEIERQTFSDGVTREATSWYHQFVTHFFDLADRIADRTSHPFSLRFKQRLSKMKAYLVAMTTQGELVRHGDADDGFALLLADNIDYWKDAIFGPTSTPAASNNGVFHVAQQAAYRVGASFLFMRAGQFGMGGDGYSSHAHDDFLSPIIYLDGEPVLVDPGTLVYNGNPLARAKYRGADAHNTLVIRGPSRPVQRMNFGWHRTRKRARIISASANEESATVIGQFGEWPEHQRSVEITRNGAHVIDAFASATDAAEWRFHLHPTWNHAGGLRFESLDGDLLTIEHSDDFESVTIEPYDFSPSYGVETVANMLRLTHSRPQGRYEVTFKIDRVE